MFSKFSFKVAKTEPCMVKYMYNVVSRKLWKNTKKKCLFLLTGSIMLSWQLKSDTKNGGIKLFVDHLIQKSCLSWKLVKKKVYK